MIPTINGAPTWLDGIDRDAPDWTGALCREVDSDMFFPEKGSPYQSGDEAKAICQRCPLLDTCLAYALPRPYILGIWGGTSERQRAQMRAEMRVTSGQLKPIKHGTTAGYYLEVKRKLPTCDECRAAMRHRQRKQGPKRSAS